MPSSKRSDEKSTNWIVVGSISGFIMLTTWLLVMVIAGFVAYDVYKKMPPKKPPFDTSYIPHTMQGWKMAYRIVLPRDWLPDWSDHDFDMTAEQNGLHVGIVAGKSVGGTDAIEGMARRKIQSVPHESHLDASAPVQIDGRAWQQFNARYRMGPATDEAYRRFYVYSGVEGMFQVIGWRSGGFQESDADELRTIAQSFRFPTGPSPPTPMPLTVQGSQSAYQLTVPAGWTVDRTAGFDLEMTRLPMSLRIIFTDVRNGVAETVLHSVQDFMRRETTDLHLSETSTARIGGHDWMHFTAECRLKDVPYAEEYYVYAGSEGTFQLVCLIRQNPSAANENMLHDLVISFHFPPN